MLVVIMLIAITTKTQLKQQAEYSDCQPIAAAVVVVVTAIVVIAIASQDKPTGSH